MNILFLTNNDNTTPLKDWLVDEGNSVTIYKYPLDAGLFASDTFDWIISFNYKYIVPKQVLDKFPGRCINLHISLLPFNGGCSPNLWSFINNTPQGVTIHYLDGGIDTGRIIIQKEVEFKTNITLRKSYSILIDAIIRLFKLWWTNKYHTLKETQELVSKLPKNYLDVPIKSLIRRYHEQF